MKWSTLSRKFHLKKLNLSIIILFIIFLALPLTLSLNQQDSLQKNAEAKNRCDVPLAFPTNVKLADMTHPVECSPQGEDEHQLFDCGEYYVSYFCSPKKDTSLLDIKFACRGWANPLTSSYIVHFRNRVNYVRQGFMRNFVSQYGEMMGRRMAWNYLMNEIKSGNTTYGQENEEADLAFAAQVIFGETLEDIQTADMVRGCTTNAWDKLCRADSDPIYKLSCSDGTECISYDNTASSKTPSYTCEIP